MKKRLISMLLLVVMVLGMLPATALAASSEEEALGEVNIYNGEQKLSYLSINGPVSYTHLDVYKRQMDLLTYLRRFDPEELVHIGGNTYTTRTHDSLKISNGKWCWWSRNIGGTNALDYLCLLYTSFC